MASSAVSPDVIAAIVKSTKEVLTTVLIGFTISTTLYGITCLQSYLYFKHYPKDPIYLKLTVTVLWVLDTLTTAFVAQSIYVYMVLNLDDLLADLNIPWAFAAEALILGVIQLVAQCYFIFQLHRLPTYRPWVYFLLLVSLGAFGIGIALSVNLFSDLTTAALVKRDIFVVGSVSQGVNALCDIGIAGTLIYLLRGSKSGYKSTSAVLDKLILYAISRGTMTAVFQILFLSLNSSRPDHTWWMPFQLCLSKLYVNSVLASLNFRTTEATGKPAFPIGKDQGRGRSATLIGSGAQTSGAMIFTTTPQVEVTTLQYTKDSDSGAYEMSMSKMTHN